MKKKYIIIGGILLLISSLLITSAGLIQNFMNNNKPNINNSNNDNKEENEEPEEELDEFDFKIKLGDNGIAKNLILTDHRNEEGEPKGSTIKFEIVNDSVKTLEIKNFVLKFYDNADNLMLEIPGFHISLKGKESKELIFTSGKDLKLAVKYTFEVINE